MNILIVPDKFKGSLSAQQVAESIRLGIQDQLPAAKIHCLPLADGGEGTAEAMITALQGEAVNLRAHDPLMRPIDCFYGLSKHGHEAFIEMAQASGILLLEENEFDAPRATTYGTGELIADAVARGVSKVYLGIGGSATTDGGIGMLAALGYEFLDAHGQALEPCGASLQKIASFSASKVNASLHQVEIVLMNDVTNTFSGSNGAAYVFAPQKGADATQVRQLDQGLRNFAGVIEQATGLSLNKIAGAGAGGGIAGGALAFLNAELCSGAELLMEITGLEKRLSQADLLITGEGKLDSQTLEGKLVQRVTRTARSHNVPVAIFCGVHQLSDSQQQELDVRYIAAVIDHAEDQQQAMSDTSRILQSMASQMIVEWFLA